MSTAAFSKDRQYRYVLARSWDSEKPWAVFVGLNPSTADETTDDPTIRRCMRFAANWYYGGLIMLNLFAFRATQPKDLFVAKDPIGKHNDSVLRNVPELDRQPVIVIAAWGTAGSFLNRDKHVIEIFRKVQVPLYHLGLTKDGYPRHPLYLKNDTRPQLWKPVKKHHGTNYA